MLEVKLLEDGAKAPEVAHFGMDLGYDIFALRDVRLPAGRVTVVSTGIAVKEFQPGYNTGLLIRDRSSMAAKGITTSGGVIDAGYRGEVKVLMTSVDGYDIKAGDKIAQLIPVRVLTGAVHVVDELDETSRGANGFGSTGR